MNSEELHTRLAELKAIAARTTANLTTATTAHNAALSRAVMTGDSASIKTAAIIAAAQLEVSRNAEMIEAARVLLAQAIQREREATQATARAEIEAELTDMGKTAHRLDTDFAGLVGKFLRLYAQEVELHRIARQHFRSPSTAPQTRTASRALATFFGTLANGVTPDFRPVIADAVASGAHSIRSTFDAE